MAVSTDEKSQEAADYDTMVVELGVPVFRYILGMVGDAETAEDLTQEVFLRALERLDQLRDPRRRRGWLFAIAANKVKKHQRRERLSSRLHLPWAPWLATRERANTPEQHAATHNADSIENVLGKLSANDRQVLLLVGYLGFCAAEAAAIMGVSVAAARKRWQRACRRFREAHHRIEGDLR